MAIYMGDSYLLRLVIASIDKVSLPFHKGKCSGCFLNCFQLKFSFVRFYTNIVCGS